jgi:hypothetical protein
VSKQKDYKHLRAWCTVLGLPHYVYAEHLKMFKDKDAPEDAVFLRHVVDREKEDMPVSPMTDKKGNLVWCRYGDVDGGTKELMEKELAK